MSARAAKPRPGLVVAGMHRSGTSAMARVLSLAGASLPERVLEPAADNPAGYWEPWEMVALSDRVLGAAHSRWDDPMAFHVGRRVMDDAGAFDEADRLIRDNIGERALPVLKDPRVSVLIPFWEPALRRAGIEPLYVIMVRNPLEVAASLETRDAFPVRKSLLVWAAYMLAVERDTRGKPRVFVRYEDLLRDWSTVLDRVEGLGPSLPLRTQAASEIEAFLDGSLRHHTAADDIAAHAGGWSAVETAYRWFTQAATAGEPDPEQLDSAAAEFDELDQRAGPLIRSLYEELDDAPRLRFRLKEAQEEIAALRVLCNQFHGEAERGRALAEEATVRLAEAERRSLALSREAALQGGGGAIEAARAEAAEAHIQLIRERARLQETTQAEARARTLAGAAVDARIGAAVEAERAEHRRVVRELEDRQAAALRHATEQAADAEARARALAERLEELEQTRRELAEARAEADQLRQRKDELLRSASWRLTRPMRVVARRLGRGSDADR